MRRLHVPAPVLRGRAREGESNPRLYSRHILVSESWPTPGVKSYAQDLRNNATEAERRLWSRLRRRQLGGFKFRRQHPIGRFVGDFVCLEAAIVVEIDGSQHVLDAPYDANRDAVLRSTGFRILRFWNGDVLSRTDSVIETIFEALHRPEMSGRFD